MLIRDWAGKNHKVTLDVRVDAESILYRRVTCLIDGTPILAGCCYRDEVESEYRDLSQCARRFLDGQHHPSHYRNTPFENLAR